MIYHAHDWQNFKVLKYRGMEHKMEWGCWAITEGFIALEKALSQTAGKYCFGDSVTLADLCLVPQVYNANRYELVIILIVISCQVQG